MAAMDANFARDFGYLDKFLVNVANHANTLPPERGARLKALMIEETARWAEVKALLEGNAAPAYSVPTANAPLSTPAPSPVVSVPAATAAASAAGKPIPQLTVGSLMGQPKK